MPGIRENFNKRYAEESWSPIELRPDALSQTRNDVVARLLRQEKGRVLDFGCGSGQLLIALADRFDALAGVDLSTNRIELAARILRERYPNYLPKVTLQQGGELLPLPFEGGSFNAIICCAVLEAVVDVFALMDEFNRLCRPGGAIVIETANACYVKHALTIATGKLPLSWTPSSDVRVWREQGWEGGALHRFNKQTLGGLLTNAGFTPEAWAGSGYLCRLRPSYANFFGDLVVRGRKV